MRLESVLPPADCSHHSFQAFAPSVSSSPFTSSFRSNPFASKTLFKTRSLNKIAKGNNAIRRSLSLNLDGKPSFRVEGSAKNEGTQNRRDREGNRNNKKLHCEISKNGSFLDRQWRDQDQDHDPFLNPRFDFLEPMMLGIRPEFPDWPDHETTTWATIEHKAKSLDIPLSLRMIKKKLQLEEGFANSKESESCYCSIKAAFSSTVFIIVQLQSCALQMREELCHEDLEAITCDVQKEMRSSFVWLFQQVFSRTPALMLHVMVLLADFGVHSASYNTTLPDAPLLGEGYQRINGSLQSLVTVEEKAEGGDSLPSLYRNDELESVEEMSLWNSIVDDATQMQEGVEEKALDRETLLHLVAPVSVELEPDTYEDYLRMNLLYQMNLSHEPNNPLLLCNYAQFLHLVARDYHRAEECFKRAVQVKPPDAESLTQYANFLWTVRKDYFAAEENFLQALSLDPQNAYYASRYANFLWSTGGEETCFPLNNSHNPNV